MINKTEKFKLRKSKKYKNLVSIGIGVVSAVAIGVASDNEAHASDQGSSATNSNITQAPPSNDQANNLANENKAEGSVEVKIDNSSVNMAVKKAKSEGVNVVEKTKDLGVTTSTTDTIAKQNEAIAENKKQENNINTVTNNYKVEKENYSKQVDTINAENKEKEKEYYKEKERVEKENQGIREKNKEIERKNEKEKTKYETRLKENKEREVQNSRDIENEKELIVKAGGERNTDGKVIRVSEGEKVGVQANGKIDVTNVNYYETTTNSTLTLTLPNVDIREGAYIDLKYERLNEASLPNTKIEINNENIGLLKFIKKERGPHATGNVNGNEDEIDGQDEIPTWYFRLIFNSNANKFKNRQVSIITKDTKDWNGMYAIEKKGVKHAIYVNDKKVTEVEHSIPAMEVFNEKDARHLEVEAGVGNVNLSKDGGIKPELINFSIWNSSPKATNRDLKLESGDIITMKLDPNSPLKFDSSKKLDINRLVNPRSDNLGYNHNKYGTIINIKKPFEVELLNFSDTELKVKIKRIITDTYFHNYLDSEYPMKITSFNKKDFLPDKKYTNSIEITNKNGSRKAYNEKTDSIRISNADINSVGELKPYKEVETYKIKINYVNENNEIIKDAYKENNLYYGDKYMVNVPSIGNYVFIKEKDNKILNGIFKQDLEYTLVYKKLYEPIKLQPPKYEDPKPELPLPKKPTYTSIPKELTPPTVEYTVFRLAEQPRLMKETRNEENVDINGSLVNKQATVKFELKTDELPAGREELSILEFTDTLPQGYVINEDVVKKNNSALGYSTIYNKDSHTVVFTATKALLNSLNKDVSKVVKVVTPIITGTVTNDGGTYKNNFKLNLNNKYTRYSNVVIVSTPPESTPNKVNNDEDENNIDGKVVVAGTTNYYKLLWDLDQYKGMKVSKKDIAKGFFYIDDYPEEAVTINSNGIHVIDNKGHAVVGVEVVKYDSLEVAPQEIKTLLAKTKIAPKGAFQVFKATNPEDFFNKYVVTGSSIKITNPMVVKDELKATGGKYENRAYQIDFENGYATEIITNTVPKPEPTKHNKNENDVIVDGKVIAPETVNNYTLLWDLDQYKGIVATHKEVAKGFFFVEDYPEEAVKIDNLKTTMIDSKGHEVIGVEITSYDSLEKAPEEVRTMLKEAKISPRGAFQLFKATNSEEFYNNYVKNGVSITIISPMTIIDSVNKNGGEFSNKAYQVDFGIGYETETVTNRVPRTNPEKHNYNEDGGLIDGGLVPVGTVTDYKLTWKLSDLKDTVASREKIKDGFYFVEDYPEVVETMNDKIKILDSNGQEVKGIKVTNFTDINKVSDKLKTILAKNNIMPKGAFQVFEAENPEEFYNKYVKVGIDLTIINPMKVKEDLKETGGKYENKAYEIDFGIGQATSTVENTVPKVEPVKHNYNEDNLVIDGKVVLAASSNRYKLLWDLSEYKNIEVPDKYVEKGFYFVDDYPEEALKLEDSKITMVDSKGEKVTGVEVENYDSLEKAPEEVRTMLKEAKVTPKGSFQLFKATNSKEFYNKYVKTGNSITITNPMIVKEEMARNTKPTDNIIREKEDVANRLNNSITKLSNEISTDKPIKEEVKPIVPNNRENVTNKEVNTTTSNENKVVKPSHEKDDKNEKVTINGSSYENRAYQIDFGQGYRTNVVVNNVPKIEPKKDVVIDVKTTESVDGKELELNKIFNYRLIGTKIPNNRGTKLTEYGFNDDYDETADKYQGNYRVFAMNNIKLKDGTEIKEDSELTKFTTQVFNVKEGKVEIEFDKDFLDKIDLNSEFQAEVYLQMERIKAGEIENVFTHTVNKVAVESNKVKTNTKEKEVEKPKPEPMPIPIPNVEKPKPEPKKEEPQVKQKSEVEKTSIPQSTSNSKILPNTQADNDSGATAGIMIGALAMVGLVAKRKK